MFVSSTMVVFIFSSVWGRNIRYGALQMHPYVKVKGILDDNIYLEAEDEEQSSISEIILGLNLKLLIRTHLFGLNYHFDLINYSNDSEKNNTQKQNFTVLADFNFPDSSYFNYFKLNTGFRDTSDPPTSELTERIEYKDTNLQGKLGFGLDKRVRCEIGTVYNEYNYEDINYNFYDRSEIYTGPTVFFKFLPKTSILIEGNYGIVDYVTRKNDSAYFQIKTGLKKEMTPRFSLIIKGGGEWRDYKPEEVEDFNTGIFNMEMIEKFSDCTMLALSAEHRAYESFYQDNRYFNSTHGFVKFTQNLNHKIVASLKLGGYFNAYPQVTTENNISQNREDKIFDTTIGINYKIQEWLSLEFMHRYRIRNSNFDNWDYKNNQSSVDVAVTF